MERNGWEWIGAEWSRMERNGYDRIGMEWKGMARLMIKICTVSTMACEGSLNLALDKKFRAFFVSAIESIDRRKYPRNESILIRLKQRKYGL